MLFVCCNSLLLVLVVVDGCCCLRWLLAVAVVCGLVFVVVCGRSVSSLSIVVVYFWPCFIYLYVDGCSVLSLFVVCCLFGVVWGCYCSVLRVVAAGCCCMLFAVDCYCALLVFVVCV